MADPWAQFKDAPDSADQWAQFKDAPQAPAAKTPVRPSAPSGGPSSAPRRSALQEAGSAFKDAAAAQYDWKTGGPLSLISQFNSGAKLIGGLTNAAGAAIGSGFYNLTGGKSLNGQGNAPIDVQMQNGRKVYRFNNDGPWIPVPTDASGKPDLQAISQIKRPMISERSTQDRMGNATAQALTFAVPGGGSSGARKVAGEGVGIAEGLARTPLRPVVRLANKATGGKLLDPVYQAKQTLAAAIKRDGGTPEQIAQIVNEWGATGASSPSMLDAISKLPSGGQATLAEVRGAAMNSPVARGVAKSYRNGLEANLQDNAQNLTDRLHPDPRTTQAFVDDTKALRSRNAENLYREDYAQQLPVKKETLTGLSDAPGRSALARSRASAVANGRWDQVAEIDALLKAPNKQYNFTGREQNPFSEVATKDAAPAFEWPAVPSQSQRLAREEATGLLNSLDPRAASRRSSALSEFEKAQRNTGTVTPPKKAESVNYGGPTGEGTRGQKESEFILNSLAGRHNETLPLPPEISGGTLDRARIQMREMAEQARRNGNNDLARGLSERVDLIDSTLDNAPQIQNARADYGNLSGQLDMADLGNNILSAKPSQFAYDAAAVNAKARPVGDVPASFAVEGNRNALGLSSKNALYEAIGAPSPGSTGLLNKIAGSRNLTEKLAVPFGEAAAPYQAGIGNEVTRLQNARAIDPNFGSQTAVRGADAGSEALNLVEGVANFKTAGTLGSALKALREGLTLTDAERVALLNLSTGQADVARLAPVRQTIISPPRKGLNLTGPKLAAQLPQSQLSLPPLLSKAAAEPPRKHKRKRPAKRSQGQ